MIRVAVLDDHPAVLAGLQRLIESAGGFELVAAANDAESLMRRLERADADVVILDYQLAQSDGLAVCQRLKDRPPGPAVVVYSAYAGPALVIAARIAGADALVDKRAPASELLEAARAVAAGVLSLPETTLDMRTAAMERLDAEDVAVAAMALAGTSRAGMAEALGIDRREVSRRIRRIVGRLGAHPHRPISSAFTSIVAGAPPVPAGR